MIRKLLAPLHDQLLAAFLLIVALSGVTFMAMHRLLLDHGLVTSMWPSFGVWLCLGFVGAFFWPLRYRDGMKGEWLSSLPHLGLLTLTGPWAFVLGYPL